jgi:hypothetical protein
MNCENCGCAPCMCSTPGFVTYKGYTRDQARSSIGRGWRPLVDEVFDWLENNKCLVKIIQVKEKYGLLTIYSEINHPELDIILDEAERKSTKICEKCGESGKLRTDRRWILTLCDSCAISLRKQV